MNYCSLSLYKQKKYNNLYIIGKPRVRSDDVRWLLGLPSFMACFDCHRSRTKLIIIHRLQFLELKVIKVTFKSRSIGLES